MKSLAKLLSLGLFGIGLLTSTYAHAGATCEVVVTKLDVSGGGTIFLSGAGTNVDGGGPANFQHIGLCSVVGATASYAAESCRELHKDLTVALLSGKKVTLWFAGGSGTCTPGAWNDMSGAAFNFYHASLKK